MFFSSLLDLVKGRLEQDASFTQTHLFMHEPCLCMASNENAIEWLQLRRMKNRAISRWDQALSAFGDRKIEIHLELLIPFNQDLIAYIVMTNICH